ncbi:MAG: thiol reductase thioredoxin [Planctomycetes bacterium]|nr:thiol reductase thioredoxin [Planctomycetota bacterium]
MEKVLDLSSSQFEAAVVGSDKPVVLEFFAPWCGPCKAFAPSIVKLAAMYGGSIAVYRVNIDHELALAERFAVLAVPTLIFFCNGRPTGRSLGALSWERLQAEVRRLVDPLMPAPLRRRSRRSEGGRRRRREPRRGRWG